MKSKRGRRRKGTNRARLKAPEPKIINLPAIKVSNQHNSRDFASFIKSRVESAKRFDNNNSNYFTQSPSTSSSNLKKLSIITIESSPSPIAPGKSSLVHPSPPGIDRSSSTKTRSTGTPSYTSPLPFNQTPPSLTPSPPCKRMKLIESYPIEERISESEKKSKLTQVEYEIREAINKLLDVQDKFVREVRFAYESLRKIRNEMVKYKE